MNKLGIKFKIRASAANKIAAGVIGLTEEQKKTKKKHEDRKKAAELGEKDEKGKAIKPLPPSYKLELSNLTEKDEKQELPKTLKTYCKEWLKERLFDRRKEFSSKQTEKGSQNEDESIVLVRDVLKYSFLTKNKQSEENDFFTGECDVKTKEEVLDVKNSWDLFTFPMFETEIPNEDYHGQGQVYMNLYGRKKYRLCYTLTDTPKKLIEQEAKSYCYKNGVEFTEEILQGFTRKMTYPDLNKELKVKNFDFDYDPEYIENLKSRVAHCQKYIDSLIEGLLSSGKLKL